MNRLHGENACQMCGRIPEIGWLYACRQDWLVENHQDSFEATASTSDAVPDETNYFDVMARFASSIGMSLSVVKQIRDGQYTYGQVEKLIAQKEHLNDVIEKIEGLSTEKPPVLPHIDAFQSHTGIIASLGLTSAFTTADQQNADVSPSTSTPVQQKNSKKDSNPLNTTKQSHTKSDCCNYMICHACRPFLHDRLYANIGSVVHGAYPPLTLEEAKTLPIKNPEIARGLGLREVVTPTISSPKRLGRANSMDEALTQAREYEDETPLEWTTSSNSSSFYDEDPQELRTFDPYPCPGAGICPVFSRNSGCAYDSHDFDDGQRALTHGYGSTGAIGRANSNSQMTPDRSRARHHRFGGSVSDTPGRSSSSASSISLPTPTTLPLALDRPISHGLGYDNTNKTGKAASICGVLSPGMKFNNARLSVGSDMSGRDSHDSFGSEVEVEGGVALTEEAVETGLPDIFT